MSVVAWRRAVDFGLCRRAVVSVLMLWGLLAGCPAAAQENFQEWLGGVRREALGQGISAATLDVALTGLEPLPRVIELDRRQPEFTVTFAHYLSSAVNAQRIAKGRKLMRENHDLLAGIAAKYGVQPQYIVALWGIETDYGRYTGGFSVVRALATLAFDGRRSSYFRKELLDALRILDKEHITPETMRGSWAGAMGQNQFMPSSYLKYSVDGDGDGKRDIWTNRSDVLASIANYLSQVGWHGDQSWGRRVRLPKGFDGDGLKAAVKPLEEWRALGVKSAEGGALPQGAMNAQLVLPEGSEGPAFLCYDNYQAVLKWNRSVFFGLTVGHLADRLAGR